MDRRPDDQTIGRHPGAIPIFQCRAAYRALEAVHFAGRRHGFGTAVDCATPACAVLIGHQSNIRPIRECAYAKPGRQPNAASERGLYSERDARAGTCTRRNVTGPKGDISAGLRPATTYQNLNLQACFRSLGTPTYVRSSCTLEPA